MCALSIGAISGDYISGDLSYPKPPLFGSPLKFRRDFRSPKTTVPEHDGAALFA